MLIVTFTNAAVKEMRDRITKAIKDKLLEDPANSRLQSQLHMLPGAKICTIDSFCNEVLKNNAERVGISPTYRIADPIEAKLLTRSVITSLISEIYAEETDTGISAEDFSALCVCLTGVKSDSRLEEVFELLYEKTKSHTEGVAIYERFAKYYKRCANPKNPLEKNRYCKYAIARAHEAARHFKGVYKKIRESIVAINLGTNQEKKSLDIIDSETELFDKIIASNSYEELKQLFATKLMTFPSDKDKFDEVITLKTVRDEMKEDLLGKIPTKYFSFTESEWREHLINLARLVSTLALFLRRFEENYFREKKNRAMLEYSDIERLAYDVLYIKKDKEEEDDDGFSLEEDEKDDDECEISDVAKALRDSFSSVYIDEYQDVNALQDKIFRAVSREDNRFMVGDIKQSIYSFRSAKPEIFTRMKDAFCDLKTAREKNLPSASIFMSTNFRSDEGVIDFANGIFDLMFNIAKESIGYVDEDRLVFAKTGPAPDYFEPEICIFDKTMSPVGSGYDEDEESDEEYRGDSLKKSDEKSADTAQSPGAIAADGTPADLPPLWVAKKIKEILDARKDSEEESKEENKDEKKEKIAILLRADKGRSAVYANALKNLGIKPQVPEDKDFFLNSEIQLVLCLLNVINNPRRDIYLAGLMLSPLFDFTADELYVIKSTKKSAALWEALGAYCEENPEFSKGADFIAAIKHYRALAEGVKVDALILRLYKETGLMALATKSGCKENLMLLYNYARKFESSSFEGLYSFINYVNTVISTGATFESAQQGSSDDDVIITTVHKSKGLEYSTVFLVDAGKRFNLNSDAKLRIAYAESFGFAIKERAPGGLALIDSPVYNAISDYTSDKAKEEELRMLYVALTRAVHKLFVTGVTNAKDISEYLQAVKSYKIAPSSYTLREMKSFIDIILTAKTTGKLTIGMDGVEQQKPKAEEKNAQIPTEEDGALYKLLIERFNYEPKDKILSELPEKMSISRLYPAVLGDDEDREDYFEKKANAVPDRDKSVVPDFISGRKADVSAKSGVATHNFMQFFDFDSLEKLGVDGELDRLVKAGFIDKKSGELVRKKEIGEFITSDFYKEMRWAKQILRELRFNVMLPAALFAPKQERKDAFGDKKVLLQGVIDCIIEDTDGNLHLVDYKTDRLTKEELADKTLAEKKLFEKHALQLYYYSLAIEELFGKKPTSARIYSLHLGDTVNIDTNSVDA